MLRSPVLAGLLLIASGLRAIPAYAGPPMPCFTATLSANGNILVVNDLTFADQDETHTRTIKTSTFRVMQRYVNRNERQRLNGPDTYWIDTASSWSVVFTSDSKSPFMACSYTLVTDDGEYLILAGAGFFSHAALYLYRRRDHPTEPPGGPGPDYGIPVRQISLSELLPWVAIPQVVTDQTPKWFADATFSFSPDNRTLLYKASDGKSAQVDLATGQVQHK